MILRVWTRASAALAVVVVLVHGASARAAAPANPCAPAPVTTTLASAANRLGVVDLHFFNAQLGIVTYYECLGGRAYQLGRRSQAVGVLTSFYAATFWRCGRPTRRFAATTTLSDGTLIRGTTSVRTRSCATRFRLELGQRPALGGQARVRVVDRWKIGGIRTELCITSPQDRRDCAGVRFADAASAVTRRFRLTTRGRWRVELRGSGFRVRGAIAVGAGSVAAQAPPPTLLATGDSTMQSIESYLSDEVGEKASVVSDFRPGFAISQANGWTAIAASQAKRLRPSVAVLSIGANEGFPMTTPDGAKHECCGEGWVGEFARRVRRAMLSYRRDGRGRVVWLTLPAPKQAEAKPVFAAVNTAIVRAGEGLAGVRVVRLDLMFSPGGFRNFMRYRGQYVRVREPDGIHLNVSGAAIAAREIARVIRKRF